MAIRMSLEVKLDGATVLEMPIPELSAEVLHEWLKGITFESEVGRYHPRRRITFHLHHPGAHRLYGAAFQSDSWEMDRLSKRIQELMI